MQLEYYENADDMPIFNWAMINEKDKLQYIRKGNYGAPICQDDIIHWKSFCDSYREEFGVSKEYKEYIDTLHELNELIGEYIETGEEMIRNFITIKQSEVEGLKKHIDQTGEQSVFSAAVALHQHLGTNLNLQETSVRMFFAYLEELGNYVRKNRRKGSVPKGGN